MTHTIRKIAAALVLALLAPLAFAQGAFAPAMFTPFKKGGGSVGSGSTLTSCTSSILYADAGSLLKCDPAAVVNGSVSTAGRSILTIRDTITGASATSNFVNVTGTFNAALSAATSAVYVPVVFDDDSQQQSSIRALSTGAGPAANLAATMWAESQLTAAQGSVAGYFTSTGASGTSIGVWGSATAGTRQFGGYFALGALGIPNSGTSALVADNGAAAANIFEARDNGTAVLTVADGGATTTTGVWNWTTNSSYFSTNVGLFFGASPNDGVSGIVHKSNQTPDTVSLVTPGTSNSWQLTEFNDLNAFDFQNACTTGLVTTACTDPTVIIHSHNQDTGEFLSMAHDGKAGVIVGGNSTVLDGTIRLGGTVTLTESSATNVLTIPVAVSTGTGGEIMYTVEAKDATNTQVRRGSVRYAVANNSSGTETCGVYGVDNAVTVNPAQTNDGSGAGAITSGTLTYAWSSDTSGTNSCVLKLNGVSSLTQTTFQIHYTVIQSGPGVSTGGD